MNASLKDLNNHELLAKFAALSARLRFNYPQNSNGLYLMAGYSNQGEACEFI